MSQSYTSGQSASDFGFNVRSTITNDVLLKTYTGEWRSNPWHAIGISNEKGAENEVGYENEKEAEHKEGFEFDNNTIWESGSDGLKIALF